MAFYAITSIFLAALGGLLFGYNTAVIAGAILFVKEQFQLTIPMQGWIVSVLLLGALVAAIGTGMIADWLGRKKTLLLAALLFVIGCFIAATAVDTMTFAWGRFVTGLGVGATSVVTPMYLSEISKTKFRGAIITAYQLAVTVGILAAYLVNYSLAAKHDWRSMMAWGAAPALLQLICFLLFLESPRWLISQGKEVKAHEIAHKLGIREDLEEQPTERKTRWSALFKTPGLRLAILVGILLSCFQQVTGINAVIYFAPQIFEFVGFSSNEVSILATIGIGSINVLATILAVWLLDWAGRRKLLLIGTLGMAIALCCIAIAFFFQSQTVDMISVAGMMAYVALFAIGLGPVTWVIIAEIYPLGVRAKAISLAVLANWIFNYLLTLSFLDIIAWIGVGPTFFAFAVLCIISFFFVYNFIPETKGRKLSEIQKLFQQRKE